MAFNYDLVVVGCSLEGIYAAATAATLKARVALVKQGLEPYSDNCEAIFSRTLAEIAKENYKIESDRFNLFSGSITPEMFANSADALKQASIWTEAIASNLKSQSSLASLAALGVDIISDRGEFCRLPRLAFVVNNRQLRSPAYLIATGSHTVVPNINGGDSVNLLTVTDLWRQNKLHFLPDDLVLIGGSPVAIELAQSLRRLGKNISLLTKSPRLLPQEDPEISMLIQAQLEAEGVKIFTDAPVTQLKNLAGRKWLQAGNQAIETDEIILTGSKQANVENLNLEGVGVKFDRQMIFVNKKLQTTNPKIYACGDLIGGYSLSHLAKYEVNIAVKNSLFLPVFSVDYSCIPWTIFSQPNLARVGMTEAQARKSYGKDIYIGRQYFKNNSQALITGETTGLYKLVLRSDGKILGAHILGDRAGELVSTIALAMANKIKLKNLLALDFPNVSLTYSEILQQIAINFHQHKINQNQTRQNLLEIWLRWRRG
jgi:pyruvate/2-oxoglutarate dehydrogenase complex dihydrolipoamide dehydrogenase (E3) component